MIKEIVKPLVQAALIYGVLIGAYWLHRAFV
jgi:hypothetical protein